MNKRAKERIRIYRWRREKLSGGKKNVRDEKDERRPALFSVESRDYIV